MIRKITLIVAVVFSASAAFAQLATVSTNMPASAEPGSTHKVVVTVDKPGISGFAKLQIDLPAGFSAVQDEVAGSTFSFKEKKVKYLWMALPGDNSFKVSYTLSIDASVSGTQVFDGAFSYIKDNETQKFTFSDIMIVGKATGQPKQEVIVVDPVKDQPVVDNTPSNTGNADKEAADKAAKEAADKAAADKAAKDAADKAARDKAAADKAAANNQPKSTNTGGNSKPPKSANAGAGVIFRVQIAATHAQNTTAQTFASKYNITEQVYEEQHEGWTKYTAGEFTSYTAAHSFRSSLRDNNGCEGAFVTAYNNGTRISTREALDLLGQ